jgi:hypothetical protein
MISGLIIWTLVLLTGGLFGFCSFSAFWYWRAIKATKTVGEWGFLCATTFSLFLVTLLLFRFN